MSEFKFMRGALFALLLVFAHAELPAKPQSECGVYECKGISIRPDGIVCREKGKPFASCSFALEEDWKFSDYGNVLKFSTGIVDGVATLTIGGSDKKTDTAWNALSRRFAVPSGVRRCLVSMIVRSDVAIEATFVPGAALGGSRWSSFVFWYDASGRELQASPLLFHVPGDRSRCEVSVAMDVPKQAAFAVLRLGFDSPNVGPGEKVLFSDLAFASLDGGELLERGSFVSEVRRGGKVSWTAQMPKGTSLSFRYRGAETVKELLSLPFLGPDGTEKSSYFRPFTAKGKYIQYRAELLCDGKSSPCLKSVRIGDVIDSAWTDSIDDQPPEIWRAFPSPSASGSFPLAFEVRDSSTIDWDTLSIRVDGEDAVSRFTVVGGFIREKAPREKAYSNGVHIAEIELADCRGHSVKSRKLFYVGEKPSVPQWTLRDDGIALVGDKPFFPIGIYGVSKREFNGMDLDIAFEDLKKAGFNFAHTYGASYADDFLGAARKHGMYLWVESRFPSKLFMRKGRYTPEIAAWYLGDDTSMHQKPQEVRDSHDAVKAVDPGRLSAQADVISSFAKVSEYQYYVNATDVFMPEIYPVFANKGNSSDRTCVAVTIHKMKRVFEDIAKYGDGQPRAVWPILQYFKGWGAWGHFPTREQLFATSFAAVIHGGHGITWYTYGGFYDKRRRSRNEGITSSPERWEAISELAQWLKELSPALTARRGPQPSAPQVISGPAFDPLGQRAVSALLVRSATNEYLLTVNAAPESVRARLFFPGCDAKMEVMREKRSVSCRGGVIEDDFAPFAVHVYVR